MIEKIGGTLVASAITNDETWAAQLTDATNIDRLNIGAMPTIALNWLQPHEGSIVDFPLPHPRLPNPGRTSKRALRSVAKGLVKHENL